MICITGLKLGKFPLLIKGVERETMKPSTFTCRRLLKMLSLNFIYSTVRLMRLPRPAKILKSVDNWTSAWPFSSLEM